MRATSWLLLYTFIAIPASFAIGLGEFGFFLLLTGLVSGFLAMILPDTTGSTEHTRDDVSQEHAGQQAGFTENRDESTEAEHLGEYFIYSTLNFVLKISTIVCYLGGLAVPAITGFSGDKWWFIFLGSFLLAIGHVFARLNFYLNESREGQWLVWIKLPLINTGLMTIVSGPIYGLAYLAKNFL